MMTWLQGVALSGRVSAKNRLLVFGLLSVALAVAARARPLKVYILAGQSNMQGHAAVRTFPHIGMDPETAPLLEDMLDADGNPRVLEDVYITYVSEDRSGAPTEKRGALSAGYGARDDTIGPEFTFGITLGKAIEEPILLIKTAWGGTSLASHFRPPSGATEDAPTGEYYQRMVRHVRAVLADPGRFHPAYDPASGYELAGFVWLQGWNDMTDRGTYPHRDEPGGYALYTELLAHLIRDVRRDLSAPAMRFVIGVLGVGGPTDQYPTPRFRGIHQNFRDAMAAPAAMPEFGDTVVAVLTERYWDHQLAAAVSKRDDRTDEEKVIAQGASNQGFHYLGSGKMFAQFGKAFAEAMLGR